MKASLVIPVLNEQNTIPKLVRKAARYQFINEIIVIDDNSSDSTLKNLNKMKSKKLKIIENEKNIGSIKSRIRGLEKTKNNIVIFMDGDGQHNLKDVKKLTNNIKHYDLILGIRNKLPRIGEKILAYACNVKDATTGLRVFKKSKLQNLIRKENLWGAKTIYLAKKKNKKIKQIPISIQKRKHGSSIHSNPKVLLKSIIFLIKTKLRLI